MRTYTDVDECLLDNGGCRCGTDPSSSCAVCVNIPGAYFCGCLDGHTLDSDNKTCQGIIIILVTRESFIYIASKRIRLFVAVFYFESIAYCVHIQI